MGCIGFFSNSRSDGCVGFSNMIRDVVFFVIVRNKRMSKLREDNGKWFIGNFQLPTLKCTVLHDNAIKFGLAPYCENVTSHPHGTCSACKTGKGLAVRLARYMQYIPIHREGGVAHLQFEDMRRLYALRVAVEDQSPTNVVDFIDAYIKKV